MEEHCELLGLAWGVIANAGLHHGGWGHEHPEWVEAAEQWRDRWHALLDEHCAAAAPDRETSVHDEYRLHADTGTPLDQHACDGPHCPDQH